MKLIQSSKPEFIPARPSDWLIRMVQEYIRLELSLNNRIVVDQADLRSLCNLPAGAGVVLISNHADENDPRVCLELARRSGKRFLTMCNREAFDEIFGLAGWMLPKLGLFSVKRGAHDRQAKSFAIDVVRNGKDVLMIFPEGEIFYLNEKVQPFHSGAIEICLQAILENRRTNPDWTAYVVPMVIKYHYRESITDELSKRTAKMESMLGLSPSAMSLAIRLRGIQQALIEREANLHGLKMDLESTQDLTTEILNIKDAILAAVEERHQETQVCQQAESIDQSWQLEAELRQKLADEAAASNDGNIKDDLASLTEVAQLSSWRPQYYLNTHSMDRMAETVLKLERELYKVRRPRQLASRNVLLKISDPIDMGLHVEDYIADAHAVRHRLTRELQDQIQQLVTQLAASCQASTSIPK